MTCNIKGDLLLHKWMMELGKKDRTRANVANNFDELVSSFYSASVPMDEAKLLMERAIKAHLPSKQIAENTYNKYKHSIRGSKQDYIDSWFKNIESAGWQVFYQYYTIQIEKKIEPPVKTMETGGMSRDEYLRQRDYAESYPILDTKANKIKPLSLPADIEALLNDNT